MLKNFFKYYSENKIDNGVQNFSLLHFGWFSTSLIMIVGIIFIFRYMNAINKIRIIRVSAFLLVFLYLLRILWATLLGKFRIESMLPLHLCGIMIFVEFFAVFSKSQLLKEFGYSAGLPGAFIALLTPEFNGYPLLSFQYQIYILSHVLLIIVPLLWIFGEGFKPSKSYLMKIYWILCGIAAFDAIINKLINSNYMFISKAPLNTPFVYIEKWFGYRGYVGFLLISSFIALHLMYLPFSLKQKKKGEEESLVPINN